MTSMISGGALTVLIPGITAAIVSALELSRSKIHYFKVFLRRIIDELQQ